VVVFVCAVDNVELRQSRSGKMVHVAELPEKTPEHDPQPVNADVFREFADPVTDLRRAAGEMLNHHATVHPVADCEWHKALLKAWRAT
jgi:hypothetical protein